MWGVRGVPGTETLLEFSVKTVRKFGNNRKTAQKWTKPRTVGMLGTEKPHQNFGETEKPHKNRLEPQTSRHPPMYETCWHRFMVKAVSTDPDYMDPWDYEFR